MSVAIYLGVFLLSVASINCSSVPFIRNVALVSRYESNSTIVTNSTIEQCLCLSASSFVAFNWYPNNTCQLFYSFPIRYTIQSTPKARLYFPQKIFPNASQCCMHDLSTLMNKYSTANRIAVNISTPRCLTLDNHGYLVTLSVTLRSIVRYYPNNLTVVTTPTPPTFTQDPNTIIYYDEEYYVGFETSISILSSNNFNTIRTITALAFSGVRDIGFVNNGQTMVVVSSYNSFLFFFDRSHNYELITTQSVTFPLSHGLQIVNDTFFYVTSWSDNAIYSFSTDLSNNASWTKQLLVDARSIAPVLWGAHVTIDDCDRFWFSLGDNGIVIFNNQGVFLRNATRMISSIFDAILTENYILYLSDLTNNQIVRVDPNIQC